MTLGNLLGRIGRGLALGAAIVASVGLTTVSRPAQAGGGIGPGAAIGIGLGAFALGSVLGVRWNDPRFAISWPAEPRVISDKDARQRDFDPAWHLAG